VTGTAHPRPVLVIDFGAQYAQLIARRVREAGVYSEIVSHEATAEEIQAKNPVALVLSGGPSSVYEEGSPKVSAGILELGLPVLGICYGFQVMARELGGEVGKTGLREYGATQARVESEASPLFQGLPVTQSTWL
jgi:GMP synthase (glutamine-hydrolysing)